jgi:mannan endo-1,4-beta-mannosidase
MTRTSAVVSLALSCLLAACASSADDGDGGSGGNSGSSGSGGSAGSGSGGSGGSDGKNGFYVDGRYLKDPCGNKVVLRGVNEMIIWSSDKTGASVYQEIAKTGANVVRIVWNATGSASDLDKTISNALAAKLIPMVEDHDTTGDITKIPAAVDYWTKSEIAAVLQKYADRILLNIGNEAGGSVASDVFESTYATAQKRLRDAGFKFPLIIDSTGWGSNIQTIFDSGDVVVASDPLKNTLLSIHLYWDDADGALTRRHLTRAVDELKLPLIAGEFADTKVNVCKHGSYNIRELMALGQEKEIGWLAWSWGAVKNSDCAGFLDMTTDGTFAGLADWGLEVATNDPNSIKNTSVRSPYVVNGSCQ